MTAKPPLVSCRIFLSLISGKWQAADPQPNQRNYPNQPTNQPAKPTNQNPQSKPTESGSFCRWIRCAKMASVWCAYVWPCWVARRPCWRWRRRPRCMNWSWKPNGSLAYMSWSPPKALSFLMMSFLDGCVFFEKTSEWLVVMSRC